METIKVYSPVDDKKIKENIINSPIWKNAYHEYDIINAKKQHKFLYQYTIKFDGLIPIQVTNIKKINI